MISILRALPLRGVAGSIRSCRKIMGLGGLMLWAGVSSAATVNFSGVIDFPGLNGPVANNTAFTGSLILDESVVPTVTAPLIRDFSGAADSLTLNIGGFTFSGENGNVRQTEGGGSNDIFGISFNTAFGSTVSGDYSGQAITGLLLDWRGANLFSDPEALAHDLSTPDFGLRRVEIYFGTGAANTVYTDADSIGIEAPTAVPLPAGVWLLGSGILGLMSMVRLRRASMESVAPAGLA